MMRPSKQFSGDIQKSHRSSEARESRENRNAKYAGADTIEFMKVGSLISWGMVYIRVYRMVEHHVTCDYDQLPARRMIIGCTSPLDLNMLFTILKIPHTSINYYGSNSKGWKKLA
jgi:hypothetical protein